jgi:ligand-binding sensor domain-containing protein/signal transduction histidine kinase
MSGNKLLSISFLYILVLFISGNSFAQRYSFHNLNVENGLLQSQATCIAQDKLGHLWIGTLGGLSRYDGRSFTNYTVRDGMLNNTINALFVANDGNIWIGYSNGISRFDGKHFKHFVFSISSSKANQVVSEIRQDKNGTIWFRAGGNIYYIKGNKNVHFPTPEPAAEITALLPDNDGLVIAKTNGFVYRYGNKKWKAYQLSSPLLATHPYVFDIYRSGNNQLLFGTNSGLYRIANDSLSVVTIKGTPTYNLPAMLSITEDSSKALWIGTTSGALRIKDSSILLYNKSNGLTDNNINAVLTDREGSIWFASDGQGIFRYSGSLFTVLDESTGLPSAQVMSIAALRSGRIYLGTYDAGLYSYEGGQIYKIAIPTNPAPAITALQVRNLYEIWIGTRGAGLWKYDGSVFMRYYTPTILSNLITSLYVDNSNRLWVGTVNGAVYYEKNNFQSIGLSKTQVQDFIQIGGDSILMATYDGLKVYDGNTVHNFTTNTIADSSTAQCFTLQGDNLWIGTSDNGVISYNLSSRKAIAINKSNGLRSDFIYNIIADDEGNVWAGTGYGIHRISIKNNTPFVTFYGKEQGIKGMESNHNAVLKMPDGSIWFGTTNGAFHYKPGSTMVSPQPSSIVLQSVKLFGEQIKDASYYDSTDAWYNTPYHLSLPYKKNNITFTFQGISLTGIDQLRYRYRIQELDAQWSDWTSINTVTYSALPPGKFTFIVEATAGDKTARLTYPFEIIAPFHKTSLFRLLVVIGCILLGVIIQYIVNRRKQNRIALREKLRREEQVIIRQRTAEDFHDEVGNRLTRINVLTNVLKKKIPHPSSETIRIIDQIQDNTGQLYSGTRDILWSLQPSNDSLYEIIHRLRDFGFELFNDTEVEFNFTGTNERTKNYKLQLDFSRNVIMIFKEAMNNTLKYSKAKHVRLEAKLKPLDVLQIKLVDDGLGFDIETVKKGHGIDNMTVRAKRINGRLYIDTKPGHGTITTLTFKLPPMTKQ